MMIVNNGQGGSLPPSPLLLTPYAAPPSPGAFPRTPTHADVFQSIYPPCARRTFKNDPCVVFFYLSLYKYYRLMHQRINARSLFKISTFFYNVTSSIHRVYQYQNGYRLNMEYPYNRYRYILSAILLDKSERRMDAVKRTACNATRIPCPFTYGIKSADIHRFIMLIADNANGRTCP